MLKSIQFKNQADLILDQTDVRLGTQTVKYRRSCYQILPRLWFHNFVSLCGFTTVIYFAYICGLLQEEKKTDDLGLSRSWQMRTIYSNLR